MHTRTRVAGAHASANLYSLLQTCRVTGIDGYQYLRALFARLPQACTVDDYVALNRDYVPRGARLRTASRPELDHDAATAAQRLPAP